MFTKLEKKMGGGGCHTHEDVTYVHHAAHL
jgi:hypothetical protein